MESRVCQTVCQTESCYLEGTDWREGCMRSTAESNAMFSGLKEIQDLDDCEKNKLVFTKKQVKLKAQMWGKHDTEVQ